MLGHVESSVVTLDVTSTSITRLLQLFESKPKETMPRPKPQAREDAMRMHVDDSDHCLRAHIQLLVGIRNVPWIARGSEYDDLYIICN